MKTYSLILSVLLSILFFGCKSNNVNPEVNTSLTGKWLYVGTFSHLANYACFVCPNFKPDDVIYKLTFNENANSIDGRVRNLIISANYETSLASESTKEIQIGTFNITDFKVLNKPFETEEDGVFQTDLQKASSYRLAQSGENNRYDELQLTTNEDALVFVRVR
ncbi:MAG: hypothetical protein NWQ46_03280 [Spirosomaceae bacterium]|nr:hypothetical protein [Spirosomataceae bacterium]